MTSTSETLWRITAPHFVAGLVVAGCEGRSHYRSRADPQMGDREAVGMGAIGLPEQKLAWAKT